MGSVQPIKGRPPATLNLGPLGLAVHNAAIICDACSCTTGRGLLVMQDWQPTVTLCARCAAERLSP